MNERLALSVLAAACVVAGCDQANPTEPTTLPVHFSYVRQAAIPAPPYDDSVLVCQHHLHGNQINFWEGMTTSFALVGMDAEGSQADVTDVPVGKSLAVNVTDVALCAIDLDRQHTVENLWANGTLLDRVHVRDDGERVVVFSIDANGRVRQ